MGLRPPRVRLRFVLIPLDAFCSCRLEDVMAAVVDPEVESTRGKRRRGGTARELAGRSASRVRLGPLSGRASTGSTSIRFRWAGSGVAYLVRRSPFLRRPAFSEAGSR